jgi:hypothetical protein
MFPIIRLESSEYKKKLQPHPKEQIDYILSCYDNFYKQKKFHSLNESVKVNYTIKQNEPINKLGNLSLTHSKHQNKSGYYFKAQW